MNKNNDSSHYTEIPIVEITAEEVIAYINSFFESESIHENQIKSTQCNRDC